MLLMDNNKKKIYFFEKNNIKQVSGNFEYIKKHISQKFKLNDFSGENVFFNYFLLSKKIDYKKDILIYDTKRRCKIIIDKRLHKKIALIELLKILFFLDVNFYLDSIQKIDIYGKFDIKYTKTIKIKTKHDIIKLGLVVEGYKKGCQYTTCYMSFSYSLGMYQEIDNFIENKCKGTDTNKKIALEKAISESIERISGCSKRHKKYKYNKKNHFFLNPYIDIDEFKNKKNDCDYVRIYNMINKGKYLYCPMEIINYPHKSMLYSRIGNSNGMATHTTLLKAKKNAVLENIERDCFIMMRLLKTGIYKITKESINKNIFSLVNKIEKKYNFHLHIYVIKFDNVIPVSMIIASKNGKSIVGTGIGKTFDISIEKSLQEIIGMIGFFQNKKNKFSSQNICIKHIQYYLDPLNFKNIKWLMDLDQTDLHSLKKLFLKKIFFCKNAGML